MADRDLTPLVSPFDFSEARAATAEAAQAQREAETARVDATKAFARAEHDYRVALAKQIVREKAKGIAWTVAPELARGDREVARLREARDIAEGVKDAAEQAAWRHNADRRDLSKMIEWSCRVAPLGQQAEPVDSTSDWSGWL